MRAQSSPSSSSSSSSTSTSMSTSTSSSLTPTADSLTHGGPDRAHAGELREALLNDWLSRCDDDWLQTYDRGQCVDLLRQAMRSADGDAPVELDMATALELPPHDALRAAGLTARRLKPDLDLSKWAGAQALAAAPHRRFRDAARDAARQAAQAEAEFKPASSCMQARNRRWRSAASSCWPLGLTSLRRRSVGHCPSPRSTGPVRTDSERLVQLRRHEAARVGAVAGLFLDRTAHFEPKRAGRADTGHVHRGLAPEPG